MKLIKRIFTLLAFSILTSTTSIAQQILLPVEVLGEEGKVVTRSIELSSQEATNSQKLWLQVNNLGYDNKASIKINNGTWYDLNNASVEMQAQEKARGGMVHGGFNTIRFSIPATGIRSGSNTISFRFNTSDAISNGYRVVRFNLLDGGDNKILDSSRFIEDDPEEWDAPFTDANSIAEGRDLWYNAPLKSNYLPAGRKGFWYGYELNSSEPINAKCTSCHTQDGRDLELFSYSNKSIIERAKFHQLTELEGEKIASYIRSLSTEYDNVGRYGRPWNPPYQPGPALENIPIEKWAAGAGLDAVLDEDKDMLPYMFPNGVNQEEVYKRFDSEKTNDRTLIPLAIQFPDWKHWLPMVHPMDAYNKNNYYLNPNTGPNNPNKSYPIIREYLETNFARGWPNKKEALDKIRRFHNEFRFFVAQGGRDEHWRTKDGDATKNLNDGVPRELAATSLARLFSIKNFEFVQEFELQDKAAEFSDHPSETQSRQWPGDEYNVFEVPPHFQACVDNNCNQFRGQPTKTGMYESTVWYHLQTVINGGDGFISHNSPVDYNYVPDFITKASNSSGVQEPLRYYHNMNVMYQTRTWDGGTNPNNGKGFRIRVMGPWNIYGITDGNQFNGYEPGEFAKTLDKVTPGLTAWVLNAQLRQFLTEVQKPQNDLSGWNRSDNGDDNRLDRVDKTYNDIINALRRTERKEGFFYHYAAKMYYYIPRFKQLGVDCEIMEGVIDWCQEAWPLIDWHVFSDQCDRYNYASFVSQDISNLVTGNMGTTVPVSVTMKNTGGSTWEAGEYVLGSAAPRDNTVWGTNRVVMTPEESVLPGEEKTFTFDVDVPSADGSYYFQWQMLHNSDWFGAVSESYRFRLGTDYVDDADALLGWSSGGTLSLNTADKQQGTASVEMTGSGTPEFYKVISPAYAAQGTEANSVLAFSYYVSDVSRINNNIYIEIGSGGAPDISEYQWGVNKGDLVNGWNTIELRVSDASITVGSGTRPDLSAINWFRVYGQKTGAITTRIDGIEIIGENGLSVDKFVAQEYFNIYPNPADIQVTIDFILSKSATVSLMLRNSMGQIVSQPMTSQSMHSGNHKLDIGLQSLSSGIYFATIIIDGEVFTKKVLKK